MKTMKTMLEELNGELVGAVVTCAKAAAARWRAANPGHDHGVVRVYEGCVYGWSASEPGPPNTERPGALAVASDGRVWLAVGGTDQDGAESWRGVGAAPLR